MKSKLFGTLPIVRFYDQLQLSSLSGLWREAQEFAIFLLQCDHQYYSMPKSATDLGCPKNSWYFVRWTKYRPGISKMLQLFIIIPIVHWNIAFLKLFLLWDRRKGWWSVFPWKHSVWYVCINYLQNHIIKRLLLAFFLLIHSIDLKNRSNTCILLYRWYPTF